MTMFNDYMKWGLIPYKVTEGLELHRLITYTFIHTEPIHAIVECLVLGILIWLSIKAYGIKSTIAISIVSALVNGIALLICTEPYQATIGFGSVVATLLASLMVTHRHRKGMLISYLIILGSIELVASFTTPYCSWVSFVLGGAIGVGFGFLSSKNSK